MRLAMLGISHKIAAVDVRERLALQGDRRDRFVERLRQAPCPVQVVVLSTCNRTEIYLAQDGTAATDEPFMQWWAQTCDFPLPQLGSIIQRRDGQAAIQHLFRVASGLDSMVLGEPQILGQVKTAYHQAKEQKTVGPILHRVFEHAMAFAKQVRTTTGIDAGRVSVGSIAVEYAQQIFERFDDKTVVVVGAGQAAKITLRHLAALKPGKLWIVNRSIQRAKQMIDGLGLDIRSGGYRAFDALDDLLGESDIVLTGTASPHPIIRRERFAGMMGKRCHRPVYIIDTALPRDVEPSVGDLANVFLYNIDDLQGVAQQTHDKRSEHANTCEVMLDGASSQCMHELNHQEIGHVIRVLRQKLHEIGDVERVRTQHKLLAMARSNDEAALLNLLADHTRRLINKVLHLPMSQLGHGRSEDALASFASAMRVLFALDVDAPTPTTDGANTEADITGGTTETPADPTVDVVTLPPLQDRVSPVSARATSP